MTIELIRYEFATFDEAQTRCQLMNSHRDDSVAPKRVFVKISFVAMQNTKVMNVHTQGALCDRASGSIVQCTYTHIAIERSSARCDIIISSRRAQLHLFAMPLTTHARRVRVQGQGTLQVVVFAMFPVCL